MTTLFNIPKRDGIASRNNKTKHDIPKTNSVELSYIVYIDACDSASFTSWNHPPQRMPHFSMKQSRDIPAVFGLPDEILEEIVAELDQHKDLISFALASRLCSTLVIPHHTEYRILRVRHTLPNMWAHLARRADLARNVRQVHICERHNYLSPDHFPITLIDKSIDNALTNAEESVRIRNICQALTHMHRLQVFTWSCKDLPGQQRPTSHPTHENAVLTAVSQLPALHTLNLSGKFALHALSSHIDTSSVTYPVWKVTNLTSLSLYGQSWAKLGNSKHLCHLLAKSPNLEYLVLPLEFHHLADCYFPKLRKLKLTMQSGVSIGIDNSRARFLQKHPTIEVLNWLPVGVPNLGPDCLPNLRILCTNRQFIVSLDDPESVSPPTGLLSPPCSPVTAAPVPVLVEPTRAPQKPRPIESLDVYSLDAQTLLELRCVDKKTLRKLKLHSFGDMSILHELAAQFPNIEWLCLPSFHLPTNAVHPVPITKDDWLELLPRFPNLQVFRGDGLWQAVKGKKQQLHEMLMEIVLTCPHLRELDHCDFYDKHEAYKRITFKREGEEGEKMSYTVTKPPPRDAFDIADGTFD